MLTESHIKLLQNELNRCYELLEEHDKADLEYQLAIQNISKIMDALTVVDMGTVVEELFDLAPTEGSH